MFNTKKERAPHQRTEDVNHMTPEHVAYQQARSNYGMTLRV